MAGRIPPSDIEEIKSRTNIADIVSEHVTLKSAGIGSMKGLCPFHDERTPSFHVRPQLGYFHCFGCGESGDAISFLQKIDHVTFSDAVERLAERIGYTIHYEEGQRSDEQDGPRRARLLAANQAAESYFRDQLQTPDADAARRFLGGRGFDPSAAERFGVGYAPQGWDGVTSALRSAGFSDAELLAAGLVSQSDRGGVYDRFRGRVIWPIRDVTGQTVGFGARRLFDDDKGPKYLNTPETAVFHKAQVLYGLDLAKRDVARQKQVVVVEGYTDVMAAHLAGVTTAVATSGTAFGTDHIKLIRRIMGDDGAGGGVVFTFDPDQAGQKAAMRAFAEERRFSAQTYVAVPPEGLDPCDLRLAKGDQAVRDLVDNRVPLFEFAIRQVLSRFDLESVEGQVHALREAAPIVAELRDPAVRPRYVHVLARSLGMDLDEVQSAVTAAGRVGGQELAPPDPDDGYNTRPAGLRDLPQDPATRLERDALMAVLQYPDLVGAQRAAGVALATVEEATLATVRDAVAANLGGYGTQGWVDRLIETAPQPYQALIREMAIAPLPERSEDQLAPYVRGITASLIDRDSLRQTHELLRRLQRTSPTDREAYREIQTRLVELESERRALRES
ncbi:DNA primase [Mycetocola reblochoni]|uniref:DNA primase n=2 Tax=Mycetocola reblochoni TaxID=331618 RepID=A0A1R4K4J3_9MICO|nr:DNA primase [Mycetocola reblochoni]RLP69879.1 DNA primase [Mycetocola reblochoni]SJN39094.1 DNA primase [Mycetocola reblochoni REB411]